MATHLILSSVLIYLPLLLLFVMVPPPLLLLLLLFPAIKGTRGCVRALDRRKSKDTQVGGLKGMATEQFSIEPAAVFKPEATEAMGVRHARHSPPPLLLLLFTMPPACSMKTLSPCDAGTQKV